jgi:cell division protein FtsL
MIALLRFEKLWQTINSFIQKLQVKWSKTFKALEIICVAIFLLQSHVLLYPLPSHPEVSIKAKYVKIQINVLFIDEMIRGQSKNFTELHQTFNKIGRIILFKLFEEINPLCNFVDERPL